MNFFYSIIPKYNEFIGIVIFVYYIKNRYKKYKNDDFTKYFWQIKRYVVKVDIETMPII